MQENSPQHIIGRIRHIMATTHLSQAGLARRIGLDASNVSKYLSGRLPVSESLINRIIVNLGVSQRWLRDGIGFPYEKDAALRHPHAEGTLLPAADGAATPQAIPLFDINVVAGTAEADRAFTAENVIGYVSLPQFNPRWAVVQAQGDSMKPVIDNGGYIAFLPQDDIDNILWGQIYIVVMEHRRVVKYVRRHKDPTKVILKSANPEYDPMEVRLADIAALYPVKAIVNVHLCL